MKKYDILNGANDGLATVEANSAKQAIEIWKTKLWHRNPNARGVHAVLIQDEPAARGDKNDIINYLMDALGSEATREDAELVYDALRADDRIYADRGLLSLRSDVDILAVFESLS